MAFKRRRGKSLQRRSIRRKRVKRSYKSKGRLTLYRNPFPEKKHVQLVYYDQGVIDPSNSGGVTPTQVQIYRANSLFDPDFTSGGHQPRFRDILASIYERYVVVSSRLKVTLWAPASSSSGQLMCFAGVRPNANDIPTPTQTYVDLAENGGIRFRPLGARDGGTDVTRLVATYSPKKLFKKSAFYEDDLQALFGSNPSTSPVLYFGVTPVVTSDDLGGVRYVVKMSFNVLCMRKKHDIIKD